MVQRSFFALDSEDLMVTGSSDGSLIGTSIRNNSDTPNGTTFLFDGPGLREVTVDDTGGGSDTFNDDQSSNHVIVDGGGLVDAGKNVESESRIVLRQLDSDGNPFGPDIEVFVLSKDGTFTDIWGVGLTQPLVRGAEYIKVGGDNTGSVLYNTLISCFSAGTRIKTATGGVAVEDLQPGDTVWTMDSGDQPVTWVGKTEVCARGAFAPVRIEAGVLGNTEDLLVSQHHRVLFESAAAELCFGHSAVLVAAKHLCGLPGVALCPMEQLRYYHFMFDRHQIVNSNGAWTESFFLADQSLSGLDRATRAELLSFFPDLKSGFAQFGSTAAVALTARETIALRSYLAA